jgi:hypothetical protein
MTFYVWFHFRNARTNNQMHKLGISSKCNLPLSCDTVCVLEPSTRKHLLQAQLVFYSERFLLHELIASEYFLDLFSD